MLLVPATGGKGWRSWDTVAGCGGRVVPGALAKAGKRRLKLRDGAACASVGPMDLDARAASSDGPGVGGKPRSCATRLSTADGPPAEIAACQMEERAKSVVTLLSSSLSVGILTPSAEASGIGARNACGAARVDALVNALMGSALVRSALIFCAGNDRVVAGALELLTICEAVVPGAPGAADPIFVGRPMVAGASSATSSSSSPSSGSGE